MRSNGELSRDKASRMLQNEAVAHLIASLPMVRKVHMPKSYALSYISVQPYWPKGAGGRLSAPSIQSEEDALHRAKLQSYCDRAVQWLSGFRINAWTAHGWLCIERSVISYEKVGVAWLYASQQEELGDWEKGEEVEIICSKDNPDVDVDEQTSKERLIRFQSLLNTHFESEVNVDTDRKGDRS